MTNPPAAGVSRREPTSEEFIAMQKSPQFQKLRRTYRQFTFPVSVLFFVWFLFYVLVATYFPDAMAQPFLGLNIGLWLGLAQFFTTFLITWIYVVYANKNIEPQAAAIREEMEG
ncbi:hypothetical protein CCYS_04670 [Corynebacterium cystitidis DSM 20524]|uniref:Uncharacterized membrane protein, DUF485 family n=2 Tax=Corynebacterium cystitidis TaxID=35757 RepID=A0A1H9WHS8_9CORY|nr:hypothetical protein CCYS_04670 [Corynebacterium cystitidis DSM 20524]SES33299.1 Uncharacterized membrane protein, DUF485 family [Corynebacterium cystitidis DSM 20524]SNV82499.1 putative integral membrane protein [Corynebacterium cystitidis]